MGRRIASDPAGVCAWAFHLWRKCRYQISIGWDARMTSSEDVVYAAGLTPDQVKYVYRDIAAERKATRYQHLKPLLVETVDEISY